MEITERQEGGAAVVTLIGDIDLETSPHLRTALKAKAQQAKADPNGPAARVILDFSGVTYIDSSGLATLIEYYQTTRASGGQLLLAGVTKRVRSAFELVRLHEIFSFHDTVDAAVKAVRPGNS